MDTTDYGACSFCGAKMVKNPNTEKIFCSEKCWNKKEKGKEEQSNHPELLERVISIENKLSRLVMILELIYPEMLKESERREAESGNMNEIKKLI